jgi:hypothetical protein
MVALDSDHFDAADAHAHVALTIYEPLHDPWGTLESRLLLAQLALARADQGAAGLVASCDEATPEEAEPRQHRSLTRAWLAQTEQRWGDALAELDAARAAYSLGTGEANGSSKPIDAGPRTGDHTPHLLVRLAGLEWPDEAAPTRIEGWLSQLDAAAARPPASVPPSPRRLAT